MAIVYWTLAYRDCTHFDNMTLGEYVDHSGDLNKILDNLTHYELRHDKCLMHIIGPNGLIQHFEHLDLNFNV